MACPPATRPSVVSTEVACQILPLEEKPRRAPMRARDRLFGRLEVHQEPALLRRVQDVAEPHGGVACKRRGSLLQRPGTTIVGEGGQRLLDGSGRPARRHLYRNGCDAKAAG